MLNYNEPRQNQMESLDNENPSELEMEKRTEDIKSKLVVKAVRNVRRGYEAVEECIDRRLSWTFKDLV